MANTTAVIGYGAQFFMASATGEAAPLTKLAAVIAIGLPNPQTDEVEATHFESPGRAREYIAGLIDNGEITLSTNFIAGGDTDTLITAAMAAGENRNMKVIIPTPAGSPDQEFLFPGLVKGYEKNIPIDDRQTATITIRVAGNVVQQAVAAGGG